MIRGSFFALQIRDNYKKEKTMTQILIIDDDDDFRKMLNLMLKQAGYDVVDAADGNEGLKSYNKEQIDLVVTDIFMPEKEGIETVMELRTINPDVKIIAISGGGTRGNLNYLDHMKILGVQKTLDKPFDPEELLAAVTELLD